MLNYFFAINWATEEYLNILVINLKFRHELIPLSICIFLIGLIGFLESFEFLSILINTEIMMLGINFNLIINSILWEDYFGQVYALCFLAITAAETAVGLGILILLYRTKGKITFDDFSTLKG
jgi:NADH-quinone oxidoreductase subunit K